MCVVERGGECVDGGKRDAGTFVVWCGGQLRGLQGLQRGGWGGGGGGTGSLGILNKLHAQPFCMS